MTAQAPIVTLTMNPALDVTSAVAEVVPEHKLRCGPSRTDPGGGGVNVGRAIRSLGGDALAVLLLGGPTGEAYRRAVDATGLPLRVLPISGETRESFTVDETSTGRQFRFVLQGPTVAEPEWRAALDAVANALPTGGYLVASGSLPPGVPDDFYALLARRCHDEDVAFVVDASGPALRAAVEVGVDLIKPSASELAGLTGCDPSDEAALVDAARSLVAAGRARHVALSLGASGAALVGAEGTVRLRAPRMRAVSTVGAGDAFLGALVLRLAQGVPAAAAARTAVAAGTATAIRPATELCLPEDVARLERDVTG